MDRLSRSEAIRMIAAHEMRGLSLEEREGIILDWWFIDCDDEDYNHLPEAVKEDMRLYESPPNPADRRYDVLAELRTAR